MKASSEREYFEGTREIGEWRNHRCWPLLRRKGLCSGWRWGVAGGGSRREVWTVCALSNRILCADGDGLDLLCSVWSPAQGQCSPGTRTKAWFCYHVQQCSSRNLVSCTEGTLLKQISLQFSGTSPYSDPRFLQEGLAACVEG